MTFSQTNAQLVIDLALLNSKFSRRIDAALSVHGISFTEFLVLSRLQNVPGETLRRIELAESVGLTASGITRLLLPMQKIGLVEKKSNPRDARVSLVKLSNTGKRVLGEARISFDHTATDLLARLSPDQSEQWLDLSGMLL